MYNNEFLKLVGLLKQESSAHITFEVARAAENKALQQIISNLNVTNQQLNENIGTLLEKIRLFRDPKKSSGNSSIPLSKDEKSTSKNR